jgi:WD40 repeat protein
LGGHDGAVWSVAFSPDNRYVATAGRDGVVQIHATQNDDLVRVALARLSRSGIEELRREFGASLAAYGEAGTP